MRRPQQLGFNSVFKSEEERVAKRLIGVVVVAPVEGDYALDPDDNFWQFDGNKWVKKHNARERTIMPLRRTVPPRLDWEKLWVGEQS